MNTVIGYVIVFLGGILFSYVTFVVIKIFKAKSGIRYDDYKKLPLLIRLKDTLRHIIYEYSIKRNNEDFLLNISHKGARVMQVMHRSHFPYLAKNSEKISFGLALYIPVTKLTDSQKQLLERILIEESDNYQKENQPFDYHVIDLGKGLKHGGYLITRILKEVFKYDLDEANFSMELFSEGKLPYFGEKHSFQISSN
jgi:hypothetical protein